MTAAFDWFVVMLMSCGSTEVTSSTVGAHMVRVCVCVCVCVQALDWSLRPDVVINLSLSH
jgi:hypothetical protein